MNIDLEKAGIEIGLSALEGIVKMISSGEVWDTIYGLVESYKEADMEGKDKAEAVYREVKPLFYEGFSWFLKVVIQVAYKVMVEVLTDAGKEVVSDGNS